MTYAQLIGIAFVGMFAFIFIGTSRFIEKYPQLFKSCIALVFVCALACIFFGIDLLTGWVDPFQGADTNKAAATHGGKGGVVIFAIKYWPYVLIGLGGYFAYNSFRIIRRK